MRIRFLDQGDPLPEFIGARPSDLEDLMQGMLEANERMRESNLDPVLQAAATAFGFVYIHPLQDGKAGCTAVWSIMFSPNENSRLLAWCSRYRP